MQHILILDDFLIQFMLLLIICIAVFFIFDVLVDPFKLNEE